MRPWWRLFCAATGIDLSYVDFLKAGERVMNLDRAFNVREGFRRRDDHPPIRMATEDVPYFNYPKLSKEIFDGMLDEYYEANGWDLDTSIPTREKLLELGMEDVDEDLKTIRGDET
jgi:aldehyde:ferredoxin oxidoreductase